MGDEILEPLHGKKKISGLFISVFCPPLPHGRGSQHKPSFAIRALVVEANLPLLCYNSLCRSWIPANRLWGSSGYNKHVRPWTVHILYPLAGCAMFMI